MEPRFLLVYDGFGVLIFGISFHGDASPHSMIFLSATPTTTHAPPSLTILAAL
jgi:hypothetical protein